MEISPRRTREVAGANTSIAWLIVRGHGVHIKATQSDLVLQYGGRIENYPIGAVKHLLIVGGHSVHTGALLRLLEHDTSVTFFDADCSPAGMLSPFGSYPEERIQAAQLNAPGMKYAVTIAMQTLRTRMIVIQELSADLGRDLLYQGELEFLHGSLREFEFLVKMEEVRRLYRLTSDMYYEIQSRAIPPELNYRRRTLRPHRDPVNAMLSLGYAILFGACTLAVVGARMNPDAGMLHTGPGSFVNDVAEVFKPHMVDAAVFRRAREGLRPEEYDMGTNRCHLSEDLAKNV
ncbi:MAG: CRISPR-associated endonuclease Cas1, partial [Methanobacteriota archaeon]